MPQLTELRQQIEDLALRLVMSGPETPVDCGGAIEHIIQTAASAGALSLAEAASAVMEAVRAGGRAAEVQDSMARLEEAVQREECARTAAPASAPLSQDPELIQDFILESREHLATIENQTLTLERDPHDGEALAAVFRGYHTIKGLAGFLELGDIQEVAHELETVLDLARSSRLTITGGAIDIILEVADDLRRRLACVEAELQARPCEKPGRNVALLNRIRALAAAIADEPTDEPKPDGLTSMAVAVELGGLGAAPELVTATQSEPVIPALREKAPSEQGDRAETMAVRVATAKLDYLVDMAGEMVIAQSLVRHDPELATVRTPRLQRNLAQLARITAELQKTAMAMRLVPIGPLFRRMARLVRDLSRQFGKPVEMQTEGDDIELDRNIVQELADPLMHMVRNSLDHGIESPQDRARCGKPPVGRVLLRGSHHAGQVVIEISDDGRGLDREKIVNKAVQKGLIASGDGMTDSDVHHLIFRPGFTTAEQVTSVSGRGVGMDVVRRHIEKLRGRIEIRSVLGSGSTFLIKLPLTLAIIDGLVVKVGEERYIAPLFAIREMFRPSKDTVWTVQERAEMALIRGELLPIVRLYRRFGVTPRSEDPLESVLLVAEVEGRRFCVLVDELIGKQEVVIKSLGDTFKGVSGIAGGAIMGDGRVGLILDLERLLKEGIDGPGC